MRFSRWMWIGCGFTMELEHHRIVMQSATCGTSESVYACARTLRDASLSSMASSHVIFL